MRFAQAHSVAFRQAAIIDMQLPGMLDERVLDGADKAVREIEIELAFAKQLIRRIRHAIRNPPKRRGT